MGRRSNGRPCEAVPAGGLFVDGDGRFEVSDAVISVSGYSQGIGSPDVTLEYAGNQASLLNCAMRVAKNGSQVILVGIVGEPLDKLSLAPVIPQEIDLLFVTASLSFFSAGRRAAAKAAAVALLI